MITRCLLGLAVAVAIASPALGRDPANPDASVPPARYSPVISGMKSYRPVEPLPWGDVNRRVTPEDAQPSPAPGQGKTAPKSKNRKGGPHGRH
jgi:hypothetical protein